MAIIPTSSVIDNKPRMTVGRVGDGLPLATWMIIKAGSDNIAALAQTPRFAFSSHSTMLSITPSGSSVIPVITAINNAEVVTARCYASLMNG